MSNLQQDYTKIINVKLQKLQGIKNVMAVPKLTKIVVNMGVKDAVLDKKNIEKAAVIITQITGQKPKKAKAKKSIAGFKLREGEEIGLMVTLRGRRMYDFFTKLTNIVLPRLRDFHGVKRQQFDGRGNYTLGFAEHIVFPEIDPANVEKVYGLEVVIVTSANDNKTGLALLEILGMPFQKV